MHLRTLAAALLLLLASPAPAQNGSMSMSLYGGGHDFVPDLSSRDLKVIIRVLGLRPEAEKALMDLYSGYAGALQSEGASVKEFVNGEIERSEIMNDPNLLDKAHKRLADWGKRSEQIKKTFLDDLKSLLTTDQEGRWPIVERELRRMKLIGDGRLCGESVDLTRLTEDVLANAEPSTELASILNRYCDDMDRALVARSAFTDEKSKNFHELCKTDPKTAEETWQEANRLRSNVRDVNERYIRLITNQLPPDKSAALTKLYFEQSYPIVVHPTRLDEYLKDLADVKTLTPAQQARIKEIKATYEAAKHTIQEKQARAWREFELELRPDLLSHGINVGGENGRQQQYNGAWLPDTHPLIQSRKDRLELDQDTRKQIDAVLTEDQRANVPSRITPFARYDNWMPWGL